MIEDLPEELFADTESTCAAIVQKGIRRNIVCKKKATHRSKTFHVPICDEHLGLFEFGEFLVFEIEDYRYTFGSEVEIEKIPCR